MKKSKHNIPNNLNCLSSQLTDHSPTLANIYGHPWNNWRETDTMNELRSMIIHWINCLIGEYGLFYQIWLNYLITFFVVQLMSANRFPKRIGSKNWWVRTVLHSPIQYYDKRFLLQYSDILSVKHSKRISYNREYSLHLKCERLPL